MADDYPNNSSTNGRLPTDGSTTGTAGGSLEVANDSDWFAVSLRAGYDYQFSVSAVAGFVNPTDLGEYLVNSNGTRLAASGFSTKTFTYTASATGTDYLVVSSSAGDGIGSYTLTASPADDLPSNSTTTAALAPGGKVSGALEALNDTDWIKVAVRAGFNTQITLSAGVGMSNPTDLGEYLVDVNGTRLAGTGFATKSLSYVPTADGTDYLVVTSSGGDSVGAYAITESSSDDYLANSATSGRLTVGGNASGTLEGINDADWFAVTLSAGSSYQFNLAATAGFVNPSDLDLTLLNVNGTRVAATGSTDKVATFTATTSGTYYVAVSSSGGDGIGTYSLSARSTSTGSDSVPVYRFFDTKSGTQFLTSSSGERDSVVSGRPDLTYEGVGLSAASSTDPNASAVYRFFDTVYGTHFFTSNSGERDSIIANRSDLSYEGVGFYEYANQQTGSTAVYRFFDTHAGTHFYTSSATERANIVANRPDLTLEGVAFYAPS